ncbi:Cytidylate kinase [hydrothermal vent metagenome]|uniref:(d)CMP kinase n=1 Tax=hydrothermal vent metagenome TaxID=652676 RepID=A0A3B1BTY3_9ZZZZ
MLDLSKFPDNFIVAIDGPAGSGKSTLAKRVAEKIGGVMIDTGAMYRAVTAKALDLSLDPADEKAVGKIAESITIEFQRDGHAQRIIVDGADYTARIRDKDVNERVSEVATYPSVRQRMVALQREMGKTGRIVMEGRDIGSNVFPDARFKFFLVADEKVRAQRRMLEMNRAGIEASLAQVMENIKARDKTDSERKDAPLIKPPGAVEIDTGHLNIDEVLARMIQFLVSGGGQAA